MDEYKPDATPKSNPSEQDLIRLFNTVIISSKINSDPSDSNKLAKLMQSQEFKKLIQLINEFALENGISFKQSAERYIQLFREMDVLWEKYVYSLGVKALKSSE